jgi:cyclic dehypoxanthinyl futalosine synthase
VGKETGMLSLHAGANDLGSIMIEENVVSSAGSGNRFSAEDLQDIIRKQDLNLYAGTRNMSL